MQNPLFSAVFVLLLTAPAVSEEYPAGHNPSACVGYDPASKNWGVQRDRGKYFCPKNFAASGMIDFDGRVLIQVCCPLPAADILTDQSMLTSDTCPPASIVTGMKTDHSDLKKAQMQYRCTYINQTRYRLSPSFAGRYWGLTRAGQTGMVEAELRRGDLPPALTIGLSRRGFGIFQPFGCVGNPPGSLVVGVYDRRQCSAVFYSQLLFTGMQGDPAEGTAVRMFPACRYKPDPYDIEGRCIK